MAPIRVAVLGGGPGGLFVCHSMEKRRLELQAAGKDVSDFPEVVCFEKSSSPGGVWKNRDKEQDEEAPCMYDNLWTNGPSHCLEFQDYTFDEHFGKPVTVYLKRQDVLEYILNRVTKNCPNFVEKYVKLNSEVSRVEFDDSTKKFSIQIKDCSTGASTVQFFDKCVWACGDNAVRRIPPSVGKHFESFPGRMIHSSEATNLEACVKGKRVLLIGGNYSGEDIALQALKLGAAKIFVSHRDESAPITWTSAWPDNKVELLTKQMVDSVDGNTIHFKYAEWTWPQGYRSSREDPEDGPPAVLHDIDTVVFCTGYDTNLGMLTDNLKCDLTAAYQFTDRHRFEVPDGWKMSPNELDDIVGHVNPGKTYVFPGFVSPQMWNGILIDNPNMMLLDGHQSYMPLLALDVYAWMLSGFMTGMKEIPTPAEMRESNHQLSLKLLDIPYFRYLMDRNYCKALDRKAPESFWEDEPAEGQLSFSTLMEEYDKWNYRMLAHAMEKGEYPFQLGTIHELNSNGKHFVAMDLKSYEHRENVLRDKENRNALTFRDYDDGDKFYSAHTGTRAAKLERPWLDIL